MPAQPACRAAYRACGRAALVAGLLLCGCASRPEPPPEPLVVSARAIAAADVNPDAAGRASPVLVRLYLLRSEAAFAGADFGALYADERSVLGAALLERHELLLAPGSEQALRLPLPPGTVCIGAIAAFRDVRSARWRARIDAPQQSTGELRVQVGAAAIDLALFP